MLEEVMSPEDFRGHDDLDPRQIADELRSETIDAVAVTGGHLGSGLGVVELTVALHPVFDTPRDRLIWDGFVEDLCEIPQNDVAIFSAHGVSKKVEREAAAPRLVVHHDTCPTVAKVHKQSRRYIAQGRRLVLIGHAGHPEVEGTIGQISAPVILVQTKREGLVNWLRRPDPVEVSTLSGPDETIEFRLPPELASVSAAPRLPTASAQPFSQG